MKTSSPILDAALQAVQQRAVTPTNQPVHPMLANIHPVMQVALAPFVVPKPLSEAECLAIDRAMHADKINDGYGKRNEANAMRLQMADPRGLS